MKSKLIFDKVALRAIRQTLQAHKLPDGLPKKELQHLVEISKEYIKLLSQDVITHIREKYYMSSKSEDEIRKSMSQETRLIHIQHLDGTRTLYHNIMCTIILGKKRAEISDDEAEAVAQCAKALDELF